MRENRDDHRGRPVVFLNPWDRVIGPNRYLVEMLRSAPGLAERAVVVCDRERGGAAELAELGCRTVIWPEIALLRSGLDLRRLAAAVRHHTFGPGRLAGRLRALRPEVVVSNTENLWLGGWTCRRLDLPHVQVFHAMAVFDRLQRRLLRGYLRVLGSWSGRLVAVSEAQAAALRRAGVPDGKVVTVPNPIPIADLRRQARAEVPEVTAVAGERRPLLVCAGRLGPRKGQDLLVEALPAVRERYPEVLCCFFGRRESEDGRRFEERLRSRVEALGLAENVRIPGETPALPAWLRRADLCVQPSRTESFGRVAAEALVCGTPVVAAATGGLPEVVGPGGTLVAPGDVAALGQALVDELARDPEEVRDQVRRGRLHVEDRYDAGRVAALFAGVLRAAASPAGGRSEVD